jgi:hypothetical protein
MPNREWEEWQASWCFVRFSEEDDPVAYAEPTGFPEALSIWTSPASMASLEAAVERIQNLCDNHLACLCSPGCSHRICSALHIVAVLAKGVRKSFQKNKRNEKRVV